jgi:hypothetical protein
LLDCGVRALENYAAIAGCAGSDQDSYSCCATLSGCCRLSVVVVTGAAVAETAEALLRAFADALSKQGLKDAAAATR